MNNKTKALIGSLIGVIIGTQYELYRLYKQVDELETQNSKLKSELWDYEINYCSLKSSYMTLYDNMTDEEKEQFRLNFPFTIPSFIEV